MLGTAPTPAPHVAMEVSMGRVPGSAWGEFGIVHHHQRGGGTLSSSPQCSSSMGRDITILRNQPGGWGTSRSPGSGGVKDTWRGAGPWGGVV